MLLSSHDGNVELMTSANEGQHKLVFIIILINPTFSNWECVNKNTDVTVASLFLPAQVFHTGKTNRHMRY